MNDLVNLNAPAMRVRHVDLERVSDLTAAEQTHVRTALRFLRARCGDWRQVAKALRIGRATIHRTPTPMLAFRIARLVKVGVDDVLAGRFPAPGTCPYCGHRRDGEAAE